MLKYTVFIFLIALIALGNAAETTEEYPGEDWPQFLGPRQNGTCSETAYLKEWPASGPPVLWRRNVGDSYSAPISVKGRLVMFHRVGNEEVIEAMKSTTGELTWKFGYPTQYEDRYGYNNGPRSSPAYSDGRIYTYGAEGKLNCVDFESGKLVWGRPANEEYQVPQGFFGAGSAPVVEGDLILINIGGEGAGVVAFNKKTGETIWKATNDKAGYSTPIVATVNGERLALFLTQDGFLALEVKTGAVRYQLPFRSKTYESVNAATPVLHDDMVFLSATYNVGSVLLKLEPGTLKPIWRDREAMQNHWATSIYDNGYLYGMDGRHEQGSNFRCIEFLTGKVKWTADEGLGRATYVLADGHLIALGERGELALIKIDPEKYIEKYRIPLLRYPCWTPPVLSHGLLYLRNDKNMLCLDMRLKKP